MYYLVKWYFINVDDLRLVDNCFCQIFPHALGIGSRDQIGAMWLASVVCLQTKGTTWIGFGFGAFYLILNQLLVCFNTWLIFNSYVNQNIQCFPFFSGTVEDLISFQAHSLQYFHNTCSRLIFLVIFSLSQPVSPHYNSQWVEVSMHVDFIRYQFFNQFKYWWRWLRFNNWTWSWTSNVALDTPRKKLQMQRCATCHARWEPERTRLLPIWMDSVRKGEKRC